MNRRHGWRSLAGFILSLSCALILVASFNPTFAQQACPTSPFPQCAGTCPTGTVCRGDAAGGACLVVGSVASAAVGLEWFTRWLVVAPLVPWVVNRSIARRALLAGK